MSYLARLLDTKLAYYPTTPAATKVMDLLQTAFRWVPEPVMCTLCRVLAPVCVRMSGLAMMPNRRRGPADQQAQEEGDLTAIGTFCEYYHYQ